MKDAVDIKLIAKTNKDPIELSSYAALVCYRESFPKMGYLIDVDEQLFQTGHHTTFEHSFFTFKIDGISIGDITFGLHLIHPFYNTDQRSGTHCAKMFLDPDFDKIEEYIKSFWALTKDEFTLIMDYIKKASEIYSLNFDNAFKKVQKILKKERPYAEEEYINEKGKRITQEQLRTFIPSIFPTGLVFTVNLITLVSMYESAWNPVIRYVTQKMVEEVLKDYPELKFMFNKDHVRKEDWSPVLIKKEEGEIKEDVFVSMDFDKSFQIMNIFNEEEIKIPESSLIHPLDKLHYTPELINNSFEEIVTEIEAPMAVMGQDQRHRTIKRSEPVFTGDFYLSPIAKKCGLESEAKEMIESWKSIFKKAPKTLATILAPLGVMVCYKKRGSLNAVCHEQAGRLCWYNQMEIYELSRKLRKNIKKKLQDNGIVKLFEPPCYEKGKCFRGSLYCGRDLINRKEETYFSRRTV